VTTIGDTYFQDVRREPTLVCFWRCNESAGSPYAYDYGARYNLNALLDGDPATGPALIQSDETAGSYVFGGAGVNGTVPDIDPLHVVGDVSLEAWVIPYAASQTKMIVGKMGSSGDDAGPYSLGLAAGLPVLSLGDGSSQASVTGSVAPIVGIPSHVAATSFRGSMTVYLNGVAVGAAVLGAQAVADAAQPLYFGSIGSATGFDGLVGEVALYSGALSAARVLKHFNVGQQVLLDPGHYRMITPPVFS
jgi:Concanavalin A-like lectin/glucanases superfamily